MTHHRLAALFFVLATLVMSGMALGGCTPCGDLFSLLPGQFRGTIVLKTAAGITQGLDATTVSLKSENLLEVSNQPASGSAPIQFSIQAGKAGGLTLKLGANFVFVLLKSTANCLATVQSRVRGVPSAVVCFNGTDLSVDLNWGPDSDALTLSVSRIDPSEHPTFEHSSKSYTISELFQQALTQNFDSAIEFQRVVQAKLKTENDYLNLIPHLSVNSVLNIAALNNLGYLKAVGDLVPFLFPTRWLEAREAKFQAEAEFDAWILSKANAASVVEGLSNSIARDAQVLVVIDDNEKFIAGVRDQVRSREHTGLMQAGASDDIESILNSIEEGKVVLYGNARAEKINLAEAAGLFNDGAINEVRPPDCPVLANVSLYDDIAISKLSDVAIDRSYELRQISSLIDASRMNHTASFFQWLDPSGNHEGGLGFDLVSYEKISASQTQELIDRREKLEAGILTRIATTTDRVNESLKSYRLTTAGIEIQNRRIRRHLNNMNSGIAFSMSELTNALQEKLKAQIGLLNAQYSYLILQGNLNRLLLAGPYAEVPMDRVDPSWVVK